VKGHFRSWGLDFYPPNSLIVGGETRSRAHQPAGVKSFKARYNDSTRAGWDIKTSVRAEDIHSMLQAIIYDDGRQRCVPSSRS